MPRSPARSGSIQGSGRPGSIATDMAISIYDDSVRAKAFTDSLALLAPQSEYVTRARMAWQIAYGDSAAAEPSWAALDTTSFTPFSLFAAQLWGHRFLPAQERLAEIQGRRSTGANWGPVMSAWARMGRGRMRAGLEALEDPDIRPPWERYGAYWFTVQGIPLPADDHGPRPGPRRDRLHGFLLPLPRRRVGAGPGPRRGEHVTGPPDAESDRPPACCRRLHRGRHDRRDGRGARRDTAICEPAVGRRRCGSSRPSAHGSRDSKASGSST